jgi:hypothetical protein
MTAKQFAGWEQYARLEPFDETRQDWRVASIVTMMANLWGREHDAKGKVTGKPYTYEDFVVKFGEPVPKQPQTWQQQLEILKILSLVQNASVKK